MVHPSREDPPSHPSDGAITDPELRPGLPGLWRSDAGPAGGAAGQPERALASRLPGALLGPAESDLLRSTLLAFEN